MKNVIRELERLRDAMRLFAEKSEKLGVLGWKTRYNDVADAYQTAIDLINAQGGGIADQGERL